MIDLNLTDLLLTALNAYGPLVLGLALFVAAMGLPTPATPLLLAAGAFARQGIMELPTALALAFLGIVLGDAGSYALGRFAGGRLGSSDGRRGALMKKTQDRFARQGALTVFLTRNVLVSLDVPTSLIAGSGRYPFSRFLLLSLAGRGLWLAIYAGLGYAFSDQWQNISQLAGRYSLLLGSLVIMAIGAYFLFRRLQKNTGLRLCGRRRFRASM
jgi:membrane-associated protein